MVNFRCFSLVFLFLNTLCISKVVSQQVISTAGDYYSNSNGSLSTTIGEMTAIETVSNPIINLIITQGFQQNDPSTPLPLKLIQFAGNRVTTTIPLKWLIQNEGGVTKYNVQRSSDGGTFFTIGTVTATNQISAEKNYSYVDSVSSSSMLYYRLEIFEKDGSKLYSWIIRINSLGEIVKVYPVPIINSFFIEVNSLADIKKEVKVINNIGGAIFAKTYSLQKGTNKLEIDLTGIPSGTYYLIGFDKPFQVIKL